MKVRTCTPCDVLTYYYGRTTYELLATVVLYYESSRPDRPLLWLDVVVVVFRTHARVAGFHARARNVRPGSKTTTATTAASRKQKRSQKERAVGQRCWRFPSDEHKNHCLLP